MANDKDLRRVADEVAAARIVKPALSVDVSKWGEPKDTHLLRSPAAFRDDVVALFADPGCKGEPMPYAKTDQLLRFREGEVTIWGGYHESYKSTLCNELLTAWAARGVQVAAASLEMPAPALLHKTVMQAAANDRPSVARIDEILERLSDAMTIYDIVGRVPLRNMLAVMLYSAVELGVRHFLLDNLTAILSVDNDQAGTHQRFVSEVCTIARATGMHIHMVAHCNKPERGDESRKPRGYDLRGTGSAPDLADNVCMVWRNKPKEAKIDEGRDDDETRKEPDVVVVVDKQRNWDFRGLLNFWLDKRCLRFKQYGNEDPVPFL